MTIEKLLEKFQTYNTKDCENVKKAYLMAANYHQNQKRASGEDYIIHPLHVASTLCDLHADTDTICAALLHDTLEDTELDYDSIVSVFNEEVAMLVDGVTKLSNIDFYSKEELSLANTRKLLTGLLKDVRIILIKLADRLHNMQTLNYKLSDKQKEKAKETLEIFVPLANFLGAYHIKYQLADLSFKYLDPSAYEDIKVKKEQLEKEYLPVIDAMADLLNEQFKNINLSAKMWARSKNIQEINRALNKGKKITDIHDILALKIVVDNPYDCYLALGVVHHFFHPINTEFRDYISNPRTNKYQSIHTSVFAFDKAIIQVRIRTKEMDLTAKNGIAAYFDLYPNNAKEMMQDEIAKNYQAFKSLKVIDEAFLDDYQFFEHVKREFLDEKVNVYDNAGNTVELPVGSTLVDFICKVYKEDISDVISVIVNDEKKEFNYVLQDKDRVKVIINKLYDTQDRDWKQYATTAEAKQLILKPKKILDE